MGQALKANFEEELFSYLTEPLDTLQIIIFSLVVSAHAPGEEYIDDPNLKWIQVRARSALACRSRGPTRCIHRPISTPHLY